MRKILLLMVVLFLTSCTYLKTVKLIKNGEIAQKEFNVKIPFEYRFGRIVLKVSIKNKEYNFLVDTGAPNVISKELAKELGFKSTGGVSVGDSQEQNSSLGFTSIEKISIGGIDFLNTGAAVADLSVLGCLPVDGFIGANLMRKAIWKFDFQNQIVTISNSAESLNITEVVEKIPFSTNKAGTPIINIKLNNEPVKYVTVDLGSNGNFSLSKRTIDNLTKDTPSISKIKSFGYGASGLFGKSGVDSINYALIDNVTLGDVVIKNTVVTFTNKGSKTIGTNFFENYDLVFNWFTKELLLLKRKEYNNSTLSTFGFSHGFKENKLIVKKIYENSSAAKQGLQLDDQIVKIGETEYGEISKEQECEIRENGFIKKEEVEVRITVLRNNKELNFTLKKETLL